MEVYINDILINSETCLDHFHYLEETFELLWKFGMTLKGVFGVNTGKFLEFMVTQRGIKASPA